MLNKFKVKYPALAAWYFLALFLSIVFTVSGCAKKEIIVSSLTPDPTQEQHTGKLVWYDLFTHDLQTTRVFYQELFGWTFTDTVPSSPRVKTINRDGVPIANVAQIDPPEKGTNESAWLGYISVEDVDKAAEVVKLHKGTIYKEPSDLPERGRIAIVIDGQGAIFGLVNSPTGDPPDLADRQNKFIGSELWTTDLDKAIAMYTALAGYELNVIEVGAGIKYHLLTRDSMPRAGIVKISWDGVKPNWIPYIAVEDVLKTIAQVEKMGGRLLTKSSEETRDNPLAIIADPSGAVFGIQQIPDVVTAVGGSQP
jgi:predicted enzyme related to lactoylglutathione lyase